MGNVKNCSLIAYDIISIKSVVSRVGFIYMNTAIYLLLLQENSRFQRVE